MCLMLLLKEVNKVIDDTRIDDTRTDTDFDVPLLDVGYPTLEIAPDEVWAGEYLLTGPLPMGPAQPQHKWATWICLRVGPPPAGGGHTSQIDGAMQESKGGLCALTLVYLPFSNSVFI